MTDGAETLNAAGATLDELRESTVAQFKQRFGRDPQVVVAAPGRVNLIGEHTDYNGGFVFPMAIDRYVVIAAAPRADAAQPGARVYSLNMNESADLQTSGRIEPGPVKWSSYVQGVVAGFVNRGFEVPPFDAVIQSTVPLGGGLSSSAALEVATATMLEALTSRELEPIAKALLCQEAEHKFARVPCGIMDQFSSVLCKKDHLMLLDCRSQEVQFVPLTDPEISVLITNSNVKHELTGGEYAQRRAQCEAAAKILGVETLRDANDGLVESACSQLDGPQYRRACHVIGEIERTVKAADAIRAGQWEEVGRLMYASHASLRDNFQVSCDELDLLVDLAQSFGVSSGVIGSRMTGGGFGGCTVTLVKTSAAPAVAERLHELYYNQAGIEPTLFTTRPAQGAQRL